MGRQEEVQSILTALESALPDLRGVLLTSVDGLVMAHSSVNGDASRVAAMAATALGLGKRVIEAIQAGALSEITVAGTEGQMFVYAAGTNAVLVLIASEKPNIGLIHLEARAAAKRIAALS